MRLEIQPSCNSNLIINVSINLTTNILNPIFKTFGLWAQTNKNGEKQTDFKVIINHVNIKSFSINAITIVLSTYLIKIPFVTSIFKSVSCISNAPFAIVENIAFLIKLATEIGHISCTLNTDNANLKTIFYYTRLKQRLPFRTFILQCFGLYQETIVT